MKLSIFILLFCSCSLIDQEHIFMEPEFKPLYNKFILEGELRGQLYYKSSVSIFFTNDTRDGRTDNNGDIPIIYINELKWNEVSDATKEHILIHELGHALLNRGHEIDSSFMSYEITAEYIRGNEKILYDELFSQ